MLRANIHPNSWTHTTTILLFKNDDLNFITNYMPTTLNCTICKLLTSTLTSLLISHVEKDQILNHGHEGFHPMCNTTRQLQVTIASLQDAKFTTRDIYITYINFQNAFGSIDHAHLLATMLDLGYPPDAIQLIGNIYSHSTTSFQGTHFTKTSPILISRGTIQVDIVSPYLFYHLSTTFPLLASPWPPRVQL